MIQLPGDCLDLMSGIDGIEINNKINLFPNPNTGEFEISLSKEKLKRIEIYNIAGILLFEKSINLYSHKFNMETLSSGIYFIKVEDEKGKIYNDRIIKQ